MAPTIERDQRFAELDDKINADATSESRTAKFMVITPSLADQWLKNCNRDNRPVRAQLVDRLSRDMRAGRFIENGESIKFSTTGKLLDGQHRLLACVAAGVPFNSLVVKGVPAESFLTIDTGLSKSFSDLIGPAGERNAVTLAGALRLCVLWDNNKFAVSGVNFAPTAEEMQAFLDANPSVRDSVTFGCTAGHRMTGLSGSIVSFLHFAASVNGEQDRVETFIIRVCSGENISKSNPEFLLRKWILDNTQIRSRTARPTYFLAMVIKAWNLARLNKNVVNLRIIGGEGFPVLTHPKRKVETSPARKNGLPSA